jgi:hypothetical protein
MLKDRKLSGDVGFFYCPSTKFMRVYDLVLNEMEVRNAT